MHNALLAIAFTATTMTVFAQGPDYSAVDSKEKVQALAREGELRKIYLFPLELGGQDVEANAVYVPPNIAEMKRKLDGTVARMAHEGSVSKLTVEPEYKGRSFVPSKIKMRASHSSKPGVFEPTLDVW